ncbi:uncharacterized protein LOC103698755 [Phoenix dactylifera]|uniref:Uncharacterized protein LOC103698755 n=1 Tax=Phoenix dactylifera TaxID=42345 RepID=A0A8B8J0U5_PHODC|nr:uncharacterized protein LOC103698755 [Phoenix dactylifera]
MLVSSSCLPSIFNLGSLDLDGNRNNKNFQKKGYLGFRSAGKTQRTDGTMAKTGDPAAPLLPPPPPPPCYGIPVSQLEDPYHEPPAYVLLPAYPVRRRRRGPCRCRCFRSFFSASSLFISAILIASAIFFIWPSDPDIQVARLRLDRLRVSPPPRAAIDVSLGLRIRVRNQDFFALDYRSLAVSIGYRGRRLGNATSDGGHVRARGVSYVDAELQLDGIEVLNDAFYLIEDIARGFLPLDAITEVQGKLRLFFFEFPVQGKISCSLNVNPETQKIIRQDCYPE